MLTESQFYLKAIPNPIVQMTVLVFVVVDTDTGPLSVMPDATSTAILFNIFAPFRAALRERFLQKWIYLRIYRAVLRKISQSERNSINIPKAQSVQ